MIYETWPSKTSLELAIIRFDHRNSGALQTSQASKVFSRVWTPPDRDAQSYNVDDVFVNEDTIAAIVYNADLAFLLICKLGDETMHVVPLVSLKNGYDSAFKCLIVGRSFYLARQVLEPEAEVLHVHASATAPDFQVDTAARKVMPPATVEPIDGYERNSAIRFPEYGVLGISLRTAYPLEHDRYWRLSRLHLWPAKYDGSTLTVGSLCVYEHACKIMSAAVGSAATCTIILDEARGLGLVRYLPHLEPQIQYQEIDVLGVNVQSNWDQLDIALDDRLGILYTGHLVHGTCRTYRLSAVSYA
ncbi:hypothetical protein C8R47DRAFT_514989 [Mycena vitilis]|nr:hypothetical protein C8R47DRAFT_514989 [Mycena vitilis]